MLTVIVVAYRMFLLHLTDIRYEGAHPTPLLLLLPLPPSCQLQMMKYTFLYRTTFSVLLTPLIQERRQQEPNNVATMHTNRNEFTAPSMFWTITTVMMIGLNQTKSYLIPLHD